MVSELENLPDISFIDNLEVTDVQEQMEKDFCDKYEELTGETYNFNKADPYRIQLYSCSLVQFQILKLIDEMGKQNLLKYAEDAFLDQIGALRGIKRNAGKAATTTMRFELEEARESVTSIQEGTQVNGGEYFFTTDDYAEIAPGELSVDVKATCTTIGADANGLRPGEVTALVDSVPFIANTENITETAGGMDVEDNDSYSDRIYLAPASFSVAGPEDAYVYFVKEADNRIADVKVTSDEKSVVDIKIILENGEKPTEEIIEKVNESVSAKDKRPLTDYVRVSAPTDVDYEIELTYWLSEEKKNVANAVQNEVNNAINDYIAWQRLKIGRDINPSELNYRIKKACAKRVEITSPAFKRLDDTQIANLTNTSVTYGGVEDD